MRFLAGGGAGSAEATSGGAASRGMGPTHPSESLSEDMTPKRGRRPKFETCQTSERPTTESQVIRLQYQL